jgi:cytochrome b
MRLSMRVWDLPTRLFHLAVIVLLGAGFLTARLHHLAQHRDVAWVLLALLVWRLIWGFVGSDTARLRAFLVDPIAVLRRRGPDDSFGHAAAGGWLVLVLLALIAGVLGAGFAGAPVHVGLFWALLVTVAAHVLLALMAGRGGDDPWRAIVSGKKRMPAAVRAPKMAGLGLAALVLLCAAGGVLAVFMEAGR